MTSTPIEPSPSGRQRRVRRMAGLLAGSAVVAAVALALPALAQAVDEPTDTAVLSAGESRPARSDAAALPPTPTPEPTPELPPAPPEPTAEAIFAEQYLAMTPEEQFAFAVYVATPEERAAFRAAFAPPPPPPPRPAPPRPAASSGGGTPANAFLACVRQRESRGQYAINTGNGYYGAYQFALSTWNNTAGHAGRGDLVGVLPSNASPADQDAMAASLYAWQGRSPWAGAGC